MNPQKSSKYKEGIAKELGVHEDVVDAFIGFYYDKVRQSLSDLVYPKVYLHNLGTFDLRRRKLEQNITRQKDILGNLKKRTYYGYEQSVVIQERIELFERALGDMNKILEEKKKFKNGSK